MPSGFEPVTLTWSGESFTVPADRMLRLVQEIEDALVGTGGGSAISVLLQSGGPSISRLATAYGAALRYAGASVADDEIYLSIVEGMAAQDFGVQATIQNAILQLIEIVAPPIALRMRLDANEGPEPAAKKPEAPAEG